MLLCAGLLSSPVLLAGKYLGGPGWGNDDWDRGPPTAEEKVARMDRALDLDDDQADALLEVLRAADAERDALHGQIMSDYQPELCNLRDSVDADIAAILRPDQAEQWDLLRQQRRDGSGTNGQQQRKRFRLDCPQDEG
jgi:hypothetical protein